MTKLVPLLLIASSSQVSAEFNYTFRSDPTTLPYTNWMSYFQDFYIGDLPMIPGSHDSGTVAVSPEEDWLGIVGWLYAKTQQYTIISDSIYLSHTFKSNTTFLESLVQVRDFLELYPTEVVFVMMRIDTANPLTVAVDAKKRYIQSVMEQSGLEFATITSVATLKVKDLAGKAVIVTQKGKFLPTYTNYTFIDSSTNYTICDIWQYSSISAARARIAECFPQVPTNTKYSSILNGYALDGFLNQLPQNVTSPEMNDWWFLNFETNPDWISRKKYPMGVFLFDFANYTYMSALLDHTMNFGYSYPYNGPQTEAWTPGANITQSSAADKMHTVNVIGMIMLITFLVAN